MRTAHLLTALTAVLAAAACSSGAAAGTVDRAGGAGAADVTVLTMGQPNATADGILVTWAQEVQRQSGGSIKIDIKNYWRGGETDYEQGTIADVKAGKVDLAWVGARAFDTVGLKNFQPLMAPLLIDSQALQRAVFAAGIPDRMMASLDSVGLSGIGVLAGPLRKVFSTGKPIRNVADFHGAQLAIQNSQLTIRTMTLLGATPQPIPSGGSLDGLDGAERSWGPSPATATPPTAVP
jgi:TRAP-type C4-dicarboxylate transport system substrate-binding protein